MSSYGRSIALTSLVFVAALVVAFVLLPRPADAVTITVNNASDVIANDDDVCTLREAIIAANTDTSSGATAGECAAGSGADTITLPAGTYTLAILGQNENAGLTCDLDVTEGLTINGAGAASTIIQGCDNSINPCDGVDRVFHVRLAVGTVSISGVTITNGRSPSSDNGGGVYNELAGSLTITSSTVTGNIASFGGGLYSVGDLTVTDSTVSENFGNGGNAGGILAVGVATITNSTISGNIAGGSGGGIYNNGTGTITSSTVIGNMTDYSNGGAGIFNQGTVTVTNSTVSGNMAGGDGGGVQNWSTGTATIANSTITNNTADRDAGGAFVGDGGGIANSGGAVDLNVKNTIVAGNVDLSTSGTVDPDCFGTLTSQGYNLIETVSSGCSIGGVTTGNVIGQSANLGPLALNAPGTTQTHALLDGSPAIDAGSPDCPPPTTDQRGVTRPQGGGCDIGAYESPFAAPTPTPSPTPSPTPLPTPTPTPTPVTTPLPSATPTPTGSATATPTTTPTSSGTPPTELTQGDVDCNGTVNSVDALKELRYVALLSVSQTDPCPLIGSDVASVWGDVDCSGSVTAVDALKILRYVALLTVSQPEECPKIGTPES